MSGENYFNRDQLDMMAWLDSLPADQKSLCGWYTVKECLEGSGCAICPMKQEREKHHDHSG
jgi:hypothetical protein